MSIARVLLGADEADRALAPVGSGGSAIPGFAGGLGPMGGSSPVTEITALRYPAVFASVRAIAETGGMTPLLTYRRGADGNRERVLDSDDPRAKLLRLAPNPWMTAMEMWEAVLGCLALLGNAYLYKQRDQQGRVVALWPLPPQATQTYRDADGTLWYYVVPGPMFQPSGLQTSLYHNADIIHLRGFGLDGWFGLSVISLHRRSIRIGSAADEAAEKFWDQGGVPGGVLQTEQVLSESSFNRLKAQWETTHVGVGNAHQVAILEGGVTWQTVALPGKDAQFLESRQFQVTDVARIFRVPPHMIGDLSHATFSNIEQQSLEFVTYSLQPWLTRIEQRITSEVFDSPTLDSDLFAEFLIDNLVRADITARFTAYNMAPWMTDNEKRRRENLPALPGLDEPTRPLNVATVAAAEDDQASRVALAVAMIKAGADPLAAMLAVGLQDLTATPETVPTQTPDEAQPSEEATP